jgi:glycosyltransferase involved in cell wall biosynthesis
MCYGDAFADWDVQTSFLQRFATGPSAHIRVLPAMPVAFQTLRLPQVEVAVTSFHTFAHYARVRARCHLLYCYTPPRFLWGVDQFFGPGPSARAGVARLGGALLRVADRWRTHRANVVVASSRAAAQRLETAYDIVAPVINPPVDVERFAAVRGSARGEHFVLVSRLVPYKKIDLAIRAFAELGWPIVIIGTGRAGRELRAAAPTNVSFLGHIEDDEVSRIVATARGFVLPGEEDFGIAAVEAMAAGTPVVAFERGGALETVEAGRSGVFFREPTVSSLVKALRNTASRSWCHDDISASVQRFSERRFADEIREFVNVSPARW